MPIIHQVVKVPVPDQPANAEKVEWQWAEFFGEYATSCGFYFVKERVTDIKENVTCKKCNYIPKRDR